MRPFSLGFLMDVFPILLPFLSATLAVVMGTIFFGSVAGALLAWAKAGNHKVLKRVAQGYTYIIRCTPPIVLLFIVFYGLPKFCLEVFDTNINDYDKLFFVIISFTLLFAAPISEVMRSAYGAINKGQYEAAVSIGLSPWQAFFHIVLPQATVVALPNFGNSVVSLMKDGSLAYTIGYIDLIGKGQLIVSMNYGAYAIETYLALAILYLIMTLGMEKAFLWAERRFSQHKQIA
jgi:L-cystine transport system permease protein